MITEKGIQLIKRFESCKLQAYKLPGEQYYTIGYGHSYDPSITATTIWTAAQAEAALRVDLQKFEKYVDDLVPIPLNAEQRSALVSYTYNRGKGGLKQLIANSKTIEDYSKNIVVYWGSAVKYKNGLIRRRKAEKALFDSSDINYPTLRKGAVNESVRLIQHKLNLTGANLNEDGVFGDMTERAVINFQRENNLGCDGIVGKQTWSALAKIK